MDQFIENEVEALTVRHEGILQQTLLRRAAENARRSGEVAQTADYLAADAEILSGAVDIYRVWSGRKLQGMGLSTTEQISCFKR